MKDEVEGQEEEDKDEEEIDLLIFQKKSKCRQEVWQFFKKRGFDKAFIA